jgi:SAM-dependent methyltransferase
MFGGKEGRTLIVKWSCVTGAIMKRQLLALVCVGLIGCPNYGPRDPTAPSGGWRIIYVPSEMVVVERMLALAKVRADDIVYDLGCGDGRIVCIAAKKFGAKAVGIDIDPNRLQDCKRTMEKYGLTNREVQFRLGDAIEVNDLERATVITLFMMPEFMEEFEHQLKRLKPGTRIVAHDYPLPNFQPDVVIEFQGPIRLHTLYLWTIPKKGLPARNDAVTE